MLFGKLARCGGRRADGRRPVAWIGFQLSRRAVDGKTIIFPARM